MRWLLFILLMFVGPAYAAYSPDTIGTTDNVTTLKNVPTTAVPMIFRKGFATPGDGGGAMYMTSPSVCSLAAGVGDGGSQVKSLDNKCWVLAPNQNLVPEIWGAKGTGTDDDTGHLNDALAYVGTIGSGGLSGKGQYGISGTITIKQNTKFEGGGWDNSKIVLLNGTFTPAIKMESRTEFNNWFVDATPQNAGVVIKMGSPGDYRSSISRVLTSKGCVALDVDGISHTVRDSDFELMSATAGCGGVRVGHSSTTSTPTVEFRLVDTLMKCDFTQPTRADFGLRLEESEGGYYGPGNDIIGCINGTVIKPGAAQQVALSAFNDSVQGDTSQQIGLLIDTGDVSAKVQDNLFVQGWTSASTGPGGQGIVIQNTGGGTITGTKFIGHRAYINFTNAIELKTPVSGTITDTVFEMVTVCGTQIGSNFVLGDNSNATIRNSRIGKNCENFVGGSTAGLLYGIGIGNNVQLFATGNDLSYTGAETWAAVSGIPARNSVVANNTIDTGAGPTYAAASTVTLNIMAARIHLTAAGAATVNTITPTWNGQELCLIGENLAGAITFGTTGNIRFPATIPTGGGMVCGYYDSTFSKWVLH